MLLIYTICTYELCALTTLSSWIITYTYSLSLQNLSLCTFQCIYVHDYLYLWVFQMYVYYIYIYLINAYPSSGPPVNHLSVSLVTPTGLLTRTHFQQHAQHLMRMPYLHLSGTTWVFHRFTNEDWLVEDVLHWGCPMRIGWVLIGFFIGLPSAPTYPKYS